MAKKISFTADFKTMGIDLEPHDISIRQRSAAKPSHKSSSSPSDSIHNNNSEKCADQNEQTAHGFESNFDAHTTTLDPASTDQFKQTVENLSKDEALHKLKELGANTPILPSQIGTDFNFKREIVWKNAIGFLLLHICAVIGLGMAVFGYAHPFSLVYSIVLMIGSTHGTTAGAHRLWTHRSYKAKTPTRLVLLLLQTLAGQNCLYVWVRDHRQHHKYSDTDADPHNAARGFFFSHIGWLMSRKHPKVIEYGKKIDMSDLEADPMVMFQKDHYKVLYALFAFLLPTWAPILLWNEDPFVSLFVCYFARTVISLNGTWNINSVAHLYGTRPFDKSIFPVESWVICPFSVGECWHNYHHAFPWDYKASELASPFNTTRYLIDFLAFCGQVYDRREASDNMIKNRALRTGDDSHSVYGTDEGRNAFTTLFNVWRHPSNPTFKPFHSPQPKIINSKGYALIESDLDKNELDEERLSRENQNMEAQRRKSISQNTN